MRDTAAKMSFWSISGVEERCDTFSPPFPLFFDGDTHTQLVLKEFTLRLLHPSLHLELYKRFQRLFLRSNSMDVSTVSKRRNRYCGGLHTLKVPGVFTSVGSFRAARKLANNE